MDPTTSHVSFFWYYIRNLPPYSHINCKSVSILPSYFHNSLSISRSLSATFRKHEHRNRNGTGAAFLSRSGRRNVSAASISLPGILGDMVRICFLLDNQHLEKTPFSGDFPSHQSIIFFFFFLKLPNTSLVPHSSLLADCQIGDPLYRFSLFVFLSELSVWIRYLGSRIILLLRQGFLTDFDFWGLFNFVWQAVLIFVTVWFFFFFNEKLVFLWVIACWRLWGWGFVGFWC